ncbi:MAG: hypothetical protein K1X64_03885 [Myxococcaceae bacterium]|nr:hypothetical protein [Myxococcaceae bacterium]
MSRQSPPPMMTEAAKTTGTDRQQRTDADKLSVGVPVELRDLFAELMEHANHRKEVPKGGRLYS